MYWNVLSVLESTQTIGLDIYIKPGQTRFMQTLRPTGKLIPRLATFQSKYPWTKWLDGQPHVILQGEDFDQQSPKHFITYMRRVATKHGLRLSTDIDYAREAIIFQAYDPDLPGRPLLPSMPPLERPYNPDLRQCQEPTCRGEYVYQPIFTEDVHHIWSTDARKYVKAHPEQP